MILNKILVDAKNKKYLIINESELNELLSNSKLIIEENTYISDKIRLIMIEADLIFQEKTAKDEFIIRIMKTKEEAEILIAQRLEIYNKMWDGCGCNIDYYK